MTKLTTADDFLFLGSVCFSSVYLDQPLMVDCQVKFRTRKCAARPVIPGWQDIGCSESWFSSGKEKAHKHKQIFPVTARAGGGLPTGWGGGLPTGGQGSKVYVLCAEPKEHKRFRPGTRPGGIGFPAGRIGDRGDREIVYVPNVYVPFPDPIFSCVCLWGWALPNRNNGDPELTWDPRRCACPCSSCWYSKEPGSVSAHSHPHECPLGGSQA